MSAAINWSGFALAVLLVELTPGPNMAWLASLSLSRGRRAGLVATAGVALGLIINAMAAAAGFAALAAADPLWWNGLRYAGAALMLWLAWEGWRDAGETSPARLSSHDQAGRDFGAGLVTNILNPKAFLFYAAVLPQFLPPGSGWASALTLALIGAGVATLIHVTIVIMGSRAHGWIGQPDRSRLVRRLLSLSLVGVAAWMVIGSAR